MANLRDIAESLKVDFPTNKEIKFDSKIEGKKRRAWLSSDDELLDTAPNLEPPSPSLNNSIEKNINKNSILDPEKTGNKLGTNREQSGNRTGNKVGTNREQSGNTKIATGNKLGSELGTELGTKWEQSGNKAGTKCTFSSLTGLQRECLFLMYQSCKINRCKMTEPLALEHISQRLKTSADTIKTTIKRLVKKNCLIRTGFRNGRGGWSTYELPENIFVEILQNETGNKVGTKWEQSGNKVGSELGSELGTMPSSSSSILINNKTTTTSGLADLQDEWKTIDIGPLREIGFTSTHLEQIAQQGKLSTEIVQDSIHAFAFDLKYNKKGEGLKGSPLNYFMAILRNTQPYAPPGNYEAPQDRAMRLYLEKKRELESARQAREDELAKLAFSEWEKSQNEESKQALLPEEVRTGRLGAAKQAALRSYFLKEIWPQKRKELEKEIFNIGNL